MPARPDYAIDIDSFFAAKNIKVPKFMVKWLKKFFHLDFVNGYLVKGYEGVEFCTGTLDYLDIKIDVEGLDNIPDDGRRYTFASNHPLGGVDGVALGSLVGRKFDGKIKYLVNDFLMALKGLAPMCVPINKLGGQARGLSKLIDDAFESENHILIFPAGICSRKRGGVIRDLQWGKAFVRKSVDTGRWIVPVHFIAQNSKRFYRLTRVCDALKIKVPIPMAFLPDELYRARGSQFKVVFGEPIDPATFDKTKTPAQWAQWVQDKVYTL